MCPSIARSGPVSRMRRSRTYRFGDAQTKMTTPSAAKRAFREIYDAHSDAISRYCLRRLSPQDAQDATAEVFLVAWRRFGEVPPGNEALLWLYRVAHNVVRNAHRSRTRARRLAARVHREPAYNEAGPEPQIVRREEDQEIVDALRRLSKGDQEVLQLRAYEQLSIPQIALVVGCSDEAAKKRVARALKRLRGQLPPTAAPAKPQFRPSEEGAP